MTEEGSPVGIPGARSLIAGLACLAVASALLIPCSRSPLTLLPIGVPPAWASDLPEVERIEIEGATEFSAKELRSVMRTRQSSWRPFSSAPYRRDILLGDLERIRAFYHDHGYRQASVELIRAEPIDRGDKVLITIRVDEGPLTTVAAVDFTGNEAVDRADLLEAVHTTPGEPISASRVALDRERLIELYADRGRPYTVVTDSVTVDSLAASVVFQVSEAPGTKLRSVLIDGARETKHFVIRRELTVERGDLLRRSQVIESRRRVLETGFFRDVRFQAVPVDSASPPRVVDLNLTVVERKMGWILAGVGYNSSKQVRLSSEVGHRNIMGNAHRLVGRGRLAFDIDGLLNKDIPAIEESRVDLSFVEPWLFSTRTVGSITLFSETTREPELAAAGAVPGDDAVGVVLAAERRLRGEVRVRTSLENRWVTQQVVTARVVGADTTLVTEKLDYVTRSLSLFLEWDRRDNPFDPLGGSLTSILGKLAGALGGTSDFLKLTAGRSWYRPLGDLVVAARVRGGWIHPFGDSPGERPVDKVPRDERFRAGGATTVRGYPEDSLGPQLVFPDQAKPVTERGLVSIVANLELRFPLAGAFSGVIFIDGGNVWEDAKKVSLKNFVPSPDEAEIEDVRYSTGAGIRFGTPVGPLRLDYGYPLVRGEPERVIEATRGGEWHLSLGHAF